MQGGDGKNMHMISNPHIAFSPRGSVFTNVQLYWGGPGTTRGHTGVACHRYPDVRCSVGAGRITVTVTLPHLCNLHPTLDSLQRRVAPRAKHVWSPHVVATHPATNQISNAFAEYSLRISGCGGPCRIWDHVNDPESLWPEIKCTSSISVHIYFTATLRSATC